MKNPITPRITTTPRVVPTEAAIRVEVETAELSGVGYPASTDINVPITFLHRFFQSSLRLKEKYFINLEPDCLVTGNITIPYENYDCIVNQDPTLQWIFYFRGNKQIQSLIIPEVISFHKNEGVYREPIHDKIMGGGGDIYNMNFVRTIYN